MGSETISIKIPNIVTVPIYDSHSAVYDILGIKAGRIVEDDNTYWVVPNYLEQAVREIRGQKDCPPTSTTAFEMEFPPTLRVKAFMPDDQESKEYLEALRFFGINSVLAVSPFPDSERMWVLISEFEAFLNCIDKADMVWYFVPHSPTHLIFNKSIPYIKGFETGIAALVGASYQFSGNGRYAFTEKKGVSV